MASFLFAILLFMGVTGHISTSFALCPCSSAALCSTPVRQQSREIVVFAIVTDDNSWKKWNWTEISTVIAVGNLEKAKDLYCYAHSKNVRVTSLVDADVKKLLHPNDRKQIVDSWINTINKYSLDGLNVDIEGAAINQSEVDGITALTRETYYALKEQNPSFTLSFDIPYSPYVGSGSYPGRRYDFSSIAKYTDYLIVMDYDAMQSTTYASANCPLDLLIESYPLYIKNLSISSDHLVMAIPWYGYQFTCAEFHNASGENRCILDKAERKELLTLSNGIRKRKSNGQLIYADMMKVLSGNTVQGGLKWDAKSASPYFTTLENGTYHQYWFDNDLSLMLKYKLALNLKLGGLSMWNSATLDYFSTDPKIEGETAAMWNTMSYYASLLKKL